VKQLHKTGGKMKEPRKRKAEVDPAPSLLMILVRHVRGWYEKNEFAEVLGVTPSQVTMWERRTREVPYERLEQAFDLADIPRSLIDPSLRFLRSFLDAAKGKNRGDLALETTLAAEILPLILSAADLIRDPLSRTRRGAAERVVSPKS
jgi:transcriptional regulator with XRE-family HTH domain